MDPIRNIILIVQQCNNKNNRNKHNNNIYNNLTYTTIETIETIYYYIKLMAHYVCYYYNTINDNYHIYININTEHTTTAALDQPHYWIVFLVYVLVQHFIDHHPLFLHILPPQIFYLYTKHYE